MTRSARLVLATSAMLVVSLQVMAPAQAAPPTPPGTSQALTYTVRAGDNLVGIARKLGVRLTALLEANSMTVTSTIHPGDTLSVPAGAPAIAAAPQTASVSPSTTVPTGSTTYVVKGGDALASIAYRHGVKLGALVKANDITVTSVIVPGQTLKIPPATMAIPAPQSQSPSSTTQPSAPAAAPAAIPAVAGQTSTQALVTYLRAQVGKPYKFFTAGPDTFDCSGLVVAGYKQVGVTLPHQSRALAGVGTAVDWKSTSIAAGDLVLTSSSGDPATITHVGVALDATSWIQAVGPGQTVRIAALPRADKIIAVRRLPQP